MEGSYKEEDMKNTHLIFLHIPRTGGTSLRQVLEISYKNIFTPVYCHFPTPYGNVVQPDVTVSMLKSSPLIKTNPPQIYYGHMFFGIHTLLKGGYKYFTCLRDPIERVISTYFYWKYTYPLREMVRDMSIDTFVRTYVTSQTSNYQTRILAGVDPSTPISSHHLRIATQNIERYFTLVGTTERYGLYIRRLEKVLNTRLRDRVKQINQAPRPTLVSETTYNLIYSLNLYDYDLYNYVVEKFK